MNVDFVPFIRGVRVLCKPRLIFYRINSPIISERNGLLYEFLWNVTDKVTRLSTINGYEKGGLK